MKVKYTKDEHFYILTNFSVSANPIFFEKRDVTDFKKRILEKLDPICEIYQILFDKDQYQVLVRLKSREDFINFYRKKKSSEEIEEEDIPESTYILSQEMANIQSGYAKRFNHKYSRIGAVFARRFTKLFLSSRLEIESFLNRLKKGIRYWIHNRFWSFNNRFRRESQSMKEVKLSLGIRILSKSDLQGRLENPP